MRTRKFIALSLISAGAAILFTGCPAQPPGPCVVARTGGGPLTGNGAGFPYVAQYYLKAGSETGDCTTNPVIAAFPAGNFVGQIWAEAYGAVTASKKLTGLVPEEFGWTNQYLGDYVECGPFDPGCPDYPVALGNFTADSEDENGNCTIQGFDAGVQVVDGVTVTYNFSTVLVYATAAAGEGTQMQATVTIARDTCVRSYTAIGLWPTAVCNVDNDCNPNPQPGNVPARPLGSGTLPGIPLQCVNAAANDPVIVPNNIPQVPAEPCTISGQVGGKVVDSCAKDPLANPGTVCSNTTATATTATPCTVTSAGTDSCVATDPTTACLACDATGCAPPDAPGTGVCGTITGVCAVPYLDAFGCTSSDPTGAPYVIQPVGCGGGAKDNNGTGGTSICFFVGPSATTFPYLQTSSN
jgi:hypothetical protein